MTAIEAFKIGSKVMVCGKFQARIDGILIVEGGIRYRLAWADLNGPRTYIASPCLVTATDESKTTLLRADLESRATKQEQSQPGT